MQNLVVKHRPLLGNDELKLSSVDEENLSAALIYCKRGHIYGFSFMGCEICGL